MSAATLLKELGDRGISLAIKDGQILSKPAIPGDLIPAVKAHKAELLDEIQTQNLRAALTRLECGETPAIRIKINDHEQVLILKDDEIPESITIDCPTFTLSELKKLIGSKPWQMVQLYYLKQMDPLMRVTEIENHAEEGLVHG